MDTIHPSYSTPIFITGIGTGIGKTLVAAIVTEALGAYYWKPVQAGFDKGTDSEWVASLISDPAPGSAIADPHTSHPSGRILPEVYKLALPASPHIAAREEGITIDLDRIAAVLSTLRSMPAAPNTPRSTAPLIIEGAGGLLVPLTPTAFVLDLIKKLDATVLLVSRNYLGSINHSLLTAAVCKAHGLRVAGWIFNDQYLQYEQEIAQWSGIPAIASIPFQPMPGPAFIRQQADLIRHSLLAALRGCPF